MKGHDMHIAGMPPDTPITTVKDWLTAMETPISGTTRVVAADEPPPAPDYRVSDHLLDALTTIACGDVDDPAAFAASVIVRMHPRSTWAFQALQVQEPVDLSLSEDYPTNV